RFGSLITWLVGPAQPGGMRERISSAWRVSERAKLYSAGRGQLAAGSRWRCIARRLLPGACCLLSVVGCARDRVRPVYDSAGTITRLDYDTDRDGHVDMRAYLENRSEEHT